MEGAGLARAGWASAMAKAGHFKQKLFVFWLFTRFGFGLGALG
jgi:hypothetical protein